MTLQQSIPMLATHEQCTGCSACLDACPRRAIRMEKDEHGFLYPKISQGTCNGCRRCESVCPVIGHAQLSADSPCAYMVWSDLRIQSSSGGVFPLLSQYVLESGGVVFGVAWKNALEPVFIEAETFQEARRCFGSKYVQCDAQGVYTRVRKRLEEKRVVLFSGTPCQTAALRKYLADADQSSLLVVDFACHGVPSQQMWADYLRSLPDWKQIKEAKFRDKRNGWIATSLTLEMQDGSCRVYHYDKNLYEQAFHQNLSLRESCYQCAFAPLSHTSDLTMGDFWGIEQFSPESSAFEGASLLLTNTEKGRKVMQDVQSRFQYCTSVDVQRAIAPNRFSQQWPLPPQRTAFLKAYPAQNFCRAVDASLNGKRDIGLIGDWSVQNHGANLTYCALYLALKEMGYSVLMIERPANAPWPPVGKPSFFLHSPYDEDDLAPIYLTLQDMKALSDRCETFLLGSDQLLNGPLYTAFARFVGMQYITSNKKKIAYATSFGKECFDGPDTLRAEISLWLKQFDAISVRESQSVEGFYKDFGVSVQPVLDPVFLCSCETWGRMAQSVSAPTEQPYIAAYILDPSVEIEKALKAISAMTGKTVLIVTDKARTETSVHQSWGLSTRFAATNEEWLSMLWHSDAVITDSFHGTCFALMLHKPFVSIGNIGRGLCRFTSLLTTFHLTERLVLDPQQIEAVFMGKPIDFVAFDRIWHEEGERSRKWLRDALKVPKKAPLSYFDVLDRRVDDEVRGLRAETAAWQQRCALLTEQQNALLQQMERLENQQNSSRDFIARELSTLHNLIHTYESFGHKVYRVIREGRAKEVLIKKLKSVSRRYKDIWRNKV